MVNIAYAIAILSGVVWHTGKALAFGAIGPRFESRRGHGDFSWTYSVLYQDGTLLPRQGGLVKYCQYFPFTNAASQWLYVNLVYRFHARLGRFPPGTPVSSYI